MGSWLRKMLTLTWFEWRIIFCSLLLLPFCAVSLRLRGFVSTLNNMVSTHHADSDLSPDQQLVVARRLARAIAIAGCYGPYRANCLKKSLVLARFLQRRGIQYELKLGADVANGDFSAHAWVEHRGIPINDGPDVGNRFASFQSGIGQGR